MKRVRAGFFTSLIIILLVEIALITQAVFYPKTKQQAVSPTPIPSFVPTATKKLTPNNSIPTLPLYPQFMWTKTSDADNKSIEKTSSTLLYKNAGEPTAIKFSGAEWNTVQKVLSNKELGTVDNAFAKYSDTQLKNSGWDQKTTIGTTTFDTIAADGTTGSIWGYVKVENENLQLIILSEEIEHTKATEPPTCPCTVTYRIFEANPIPKGDLLKS